MKKYGVFASVGFEFIAIVVVAYYAGQYLDDKFKGAGLYTAALILVGFAGWITRLLFLAKKLNSPDNEKK